MKSLTRVFAAFLLAITIAFGGFSGNAHAQSVGATVNVAIDVNKTIDQILGLITSSQDFQLVVANQTQETLTRVGAYNKLSNWPLGDIGSLQLVAERFNSDSFSFASNYQIDCGIGKEKRNLQFSTSLDTEGNKKINIGVINQNGDQPAKLTWDKMTDISDKSLVNLPFVVNALIRQKDKTSIWLFEVVEK